MGQNYKIVLQYEGTRYNGWQRQGRTENTIQGKIEAVLERMAGAPVEIHGSGRTDAGVHAMGQVANFYLPEGQTPELVKEYLNRYLPEDIRVLQAELALDRFHSRLNAVEKIYHYQIETGKKRDVFQRRIQYGLGKPLDIEAMREAAALLCGTHDYKSFCGNQKMKKSTVRTVKNIEIWQEKSLVTLMFVGNGFLQHMVRIMAGTLIEVGLGERLSRQMPYILASLDRQEAGFTAPAEGLCLMEVRY
ncbi:MAG: tRNA pseudouridine(38-40) synthase TruA [Lachnospiraceae bacterium]|nr:tRNA pseudouridine(38-40) synthase TruA [Lachnospiraceae bacterium]